MNISAIVPVWNGRDLLARLPQHPPKNPKIPLPLGTSTTFIAMQLPLTTLTVAIVLLATILELVRRRKLREKYAVVWVATGVTILPLAAFPRVLDGVALSLGILSGTSLVLFLAVAFLLLLAMHLSWELSQLEEETRTLSEEVALIRAELRGQKRQPGAPIQHVSSGASHDPRKLLVIVPAFNEQDAVGQTVAEIREHVPDADILVVDDGSTDETSARASEAGALIARLPYNLGVGGAMRMGYRYAVEHDYDSAIQVDADGQHDPALIGRVTEPLARGYDLVIGARFAGEGAYQMTGTRRLASKMLSSVLSRVCRITLTDPTSGFRATSRQACELFAGDYPVEYLGDTVETLALAARRGLVIMQVPVSMRQRTTGHPSHSPAKTAVYLARSCVALSQAMLRR